jgi:hypothetical protein
VLGSGKRLFADGTIPAALRLVDSKVCDFCILQVLLRFSHLVSTSRWR